MNIALTHIAEEFPPRRLFTAADISRMIDAGVLAEDERIELIEGEIIVMAAKKYSHEFIKKELTKAIVRALHDGMDMAVEMSVQFNDNTILEPDLIAFESKTLIKSDAKFCHFGTGDLLLAIEVVDSTLAYDRRLKAPLYARHHVRELWVIDANERVTWVHT